MNFKIDLKNIDLKNIKLEDILAKLKNVEKKTWIKIGTSVGAVVFFLIIFYSSSSQEKFYLEMRKKLINAEDKIIIHCDKFDNCYYLSNQELIKNNNERTIPLMMSDEQQG